MVNSFLIKKLLRAFVNNLSTDNASSINEIKKELFELLTISIAKKHSNVIIMRLLKDDLLSNNEFSQIQSLSFEWLESFAIDVEAQPLIYFFLNKRPLDMSKLQKLVSFAIKWLEYNTRNEERVNLITSLLKLNLSSSRLLSTTLKLSSLWIKQNGLNKHAGTILSHSLSHSEHMLQIFNSQSEFENTLSAWIQANKNSKSAWPVLLQVLVLNKIDICDPNELNSIVFKWTIYYINDTITRNIKWWMRPNSDGYTSIELINYTNSWYKHNSDMQNYVIDGVLFIEWRTKGYHNEGLLRWCNTLMKEGDIRKEEVDLLLLENYSDPLNLDE